jgi:O-acetyl-ADP-ribose deacetylase (regulator of RNase III)
VIHTVGPIYDVDGNPEASLRNAYSYIITLIASFVISLVYHSKQHLLFAYNGFRNSLILAKDNNIKYIAFPAISCGVYG